MPFVSVVQGHTHHFKYPLAATVLIPGNKETRSRDGDRGLAFVTVAVKLWMGDIVNDVGDLVECEVEGLEFSGLERALTTEAHSFGCMND